LRNVTDEGFGIRVLVCGCIVNDKVLKFKI